MVEEYNENEKSKYRVSGIRALNEEKWKTDIKKISLCESKMQPELINSYQESKYFGG